MRRWYVKDSSNYEIYLTEERWEHIIEKHDELIGRLDDVLDTIRLGKRKQEVSEPQKYRYYRPYDDLLYGFNHIVVIVVFHYDEMGSPNNFTITAWGAFFT